MRRAADKEPAEVCTPAAGAADKEPAEAADKPAAEAAEAVEAVHWERRTSCRIFRPAEAERRISDKT